MEHERRASPRVNYDLQPELAVAALFQMLTRYPMTSGEPLGRSIGAHFDYIAQDSRYSRLLRDAAAIASGQWHAMLEMQRALSRHQRKCE